MELQNKKSALVFALLLAAAAGCDENRNDQTDTGTSPGSNMTDNDRNGVSSPRGNTGTNAAPGSTTDPSRPNPTNPGTMSPSAEPGTTTPSPNVNPTSPGSQPSPTPPTPGGTERDDQITQEIRAMLRNDSTLSMAAENIEVQTRSGVVTLTGRVTSRAELDAIEESVRQVPGVTSVNNNLEIDPR